MVSLQKALVGHWTMNSKDTDSGFIRDRSGYENHGTINGATPGKTGINREAFKFDGTNKIDIPNDTLSTVSPSGDVAISLWFKTDSTDNVNFGEFRNPVDFTLSLENGNIRWQIFDGNIQPAEPQPNFETDVWTHIVAQFESNFIEIYKNGVLEGDAEVNDGNTVDKDLSIGNSSFSGLLDDVRFYNRSLSQKEINALYQQRNPRQVSSRGFSVAAENLVARYPFRDGSARDDARDENYGDPTAYDGSIGGPTYLPVGNHIGNGTFDFTDSNTDDIKLPNSAVQTGNSTRTTMGWFRVDNDTGGRQMAFGSADGNSAEAWEMELYRPYDGSGAGPAGSVGVHTWSGYNISNSSLISLDEWFHFAATHDGNPSNIQLYLDGQPISTENNNNNSSSLNTSSANHIIGFSEAHSTGQHTFSGQASDLRIYNTDLSDSEISQIYQNTRPQISASGGSTVTTERINGQDYRIHAFEEVGSSTFEVSDAQANATADVLVVGGGGSGGSSDSGNSLGCGGGGGAGGLVYESNVGISSSSYSITVGDGGQSVTGSPGQSGNNGENSEAFGLTSIGGGGGGAGKDSGVPGKDGGSGGGAGNDTGGVGGSGLQPTSTDGGFGNDGGDTNTSSGDMTAGGGGAGSPGETIDSGGDAGDGGSGLDYSDKFTAQFGEDGYFAGGGGGGVNTGGGATGVPGDGGIGGGGDGGNDGEDGLPATSNTGGGGGGAGDEGRVGASGGSGIVLIRYKL